MFLMFVYSTIIFYTADFLLGNFNALIHYHFLAFLGLNYSHLSKGIVSLSWNEVFPVQKSDDISYILRWREKENIHSEQVRHLKVLR